MIFSSKLVYVISGKDVQEISMSLPQSTEPKGKIDLSHRLPNGGYQCKVVGNDDDGELTAVIYDLMGQGLAHPGTDAASAIPLRTGTADDWKF